VGRLATPQGGDTRPRATLWGAKTRSCGGSGRFGGPELV